MTQNIPNTSLSENDSLPTTAPVTTQATDVHRSPQFVCIFGNPETVVIGENNVVNIPSSSATVLQIGSSDSTVLSTRVHGTEDAVKIYSLCCVQQLKSSEPEETRCLSHSSRRLTSRQQLGGISRFFPVVKKRTCCHGAPRRKPRKKLNDRRRRNTRFASSNFSDDVRETMLNEFAFHTNSFNLEQALQLFHDCVTPLHPLRDDGQWGNFELVAKDLLKRHTNDLACQTIISLERSLALILRGNLQESEALIYDALENIPQLSGSVRLLLEVLSDCCLCQVNRRKKMLDEAEKYIQKAKEKSSGFPPSLALAIVLYEEGSYMRDRAAVMQGSTKEQAIVEAKDVMKRCVGLCCRLDRQQEVYVRKQHIAISRMAIMDLHCETRDSRSKCIDRNNIEQAKTLLETLETDYYCLTEMEGGKIQRLIANVDLLYRLGDLAKAEIIAQKALEIAERLGFNLDVMPLKERLAEIHQKIIESPEKTFAMEAFREVPGINDSSSDSSQNNTPYSSEYEDELSPVSRVFLPKNLADLMLFP